MSIYKIAGIKPSEIGLQVLRDSARPGLPSTRDRILTIPGMNGAWDFGADMDPMPFAFDCAFMTRNAATLQTSIELLTAILIDQYGKPKTVEMILDVHQERTYQVRYSGSLPIPRMVGMGRFTLPLIALDPLSYSELIAYDEVFEYDDGHEYDTGLIYPNPEGFSWIYASHMSSAYNYSKLLTPLDLTIVGAVVNPTITNQSMDESMSLSLTMTAGQTLIIRGAPDYTITLNGVNKVGALSGDFINLQEGVNGLLFSGTSPNALVTYDWQHKFM